MAIERSNILPVYQPVPNVLDKVALNKWVLHVAQALRFKKNGRVRTSGGATSTLIDIQTEDNASYAVKAYVVARRLSGSGSTNDGVAEVVRGTFKVVSGTLSKVAETEEYGVTDIAGITVTFAVSGAKIQLQVTGASGYEIVWRGYAETVIARDNA